MRNPKPSAPQFSRSSGRGAGRIRTASNACPKVCSAARLTRRACGAVPVATRIARAIRAFKEIDEETRTKDKLQVREMPYVPAAGVPAQAPQGAGHEEGCGDGEKEDREERQVMSDMAGIILFVAYESLVFLLLVKVLKRQA